MKAKTIILTMILVFASLYAADTLYSGTEDKTDRLSSEQSGIFSPGYVNAAMQKTREIINQSNRYKSPIENTAEFVKDELSNDVMEDSANKVTPELKKKTSGTGESKIEDAQTVQDGEAVTTTPVNVNPDEIPAYARDKIQEYANQQCAQLSQVKASGDKYYAAWVKDNSVKSQVFDSAGNALLSAPLNLTGGSILRGADISNITTLEDGNLAVFWKETSASNRYSLKSQIIDQSGNTLLASPLNLTGGSILRGADISNITTLKNGNLAVFWSEQNANNKYSLKSQVISQNGNTLLSTPLNLTGSSILSVPTMSNIATLKNGNLAVFWGEGNANYKYSLKSQIIDQSGNTLLASPLNFTDSVVSAGTVMSSITTLKNGNLAVFWNEYTNSSYSLKSQIISQNGNTLLSTPLNLTGSSILRVASISNITTLENGNLAVFWREINAASLGEGSLKSQIIDQSGNTLLASPLNLTIGSGKIGEANISKIATLENGNLAVFWSEYTNSSYSLKSQIISQNGNTLLSTPLNLTTGGSILNSANVYKTATLKNGNLAVFWKETSASNRYSLKSQIIDQSGNTLLASPLNLTGGSILGGANISNITTLEDGNLAVFWNEISASNRYSLKSQIIDQNGNTLLASPLNLTGSSILSGANISNITTLEDGNLAVFWNETGSGGFTYRTQVIGQNGVFAPINALRPAATIQNLNSITSSFMANPAYNPNIALPNQQDMLKQTFNDVTMSTTRTVDNAGISNIFKSLLSNKNLLAGGGAAPIDPTMLSKIVKDALALSVGSINPEDMKIASILANIMKNPTEDQKMILDVMTALLNDVSKQEQEGSCSPELKKASDDLLQMVAAVLIAQAIPDLLKEGDIANIKSIFAGLNTEKARIMFDYQESTKPYYDQIVKELAKSMDILKLKNILSNSMTKEELAKIPPNELDKIMEKLRKAKDRSFEEEYILQQEAKYRKQYIDPNRKMLDEKMKGMLESFTKKLSGVLEATKAEKK